ncbi:MAG TPA: ABC transporter permease [Candidatus Sulfomarinibacteraceae bacterium]|nr:ABC transporter permease [Candidatus Sulfomarinibacteraceae bacterium]
MTTETSRFPAFRRLWQNPVTIKELRSRMRGRRAYVVLTTYLLLMSLFISLVYVLYAAAASDPFGPNPRMAGKTVFGAVVGIQALLVIFLGPTFTAGAISGEKERQTYNLLRTTLLPAHSLVAGKLISALSYVFLLILASVPIQSIAFLLGGVSLLELVLAELLIVVSAVAFALIGLFFSSLARSTLIASVSTFAASLFLTFGLPAMALVILPLGSALFFGPGSSPEMEVALLYTGLSLASTNLPVTLVLSDVFLVQEDALFYFTETIRGYTVYIFSPWYVYLILYSLLAIILYILTVGRVRKIPRR